MARQITNSFGVQKALDNVQDWSYHEIQVVPPAPFKDDEIVHTSALGIGYTEGDMDMARRRDRNQGWVVGLAVFAGGGTVLMLSVITLINSVVR